MTRRALTLIETLAMVAIFAAATALGLGIVGPLSAGHARRAAIGSTRSALDRARLVAQAHGGAVLRFGPVLVAEPTSGGEAFEARVALPDGWSASLAPFDDAGDGEALIFDPRGVCRDAVTVLVGPNGANARLRVTGISGQVRLLEELNE